MNNKLWTKNFSIITLGTLVSMCGVVVLSFASSLLILEVTGSTLAYAVFLVVTNLPAIVIPFLIGSVLDKHSRKKMIVFLDYFGAVLAFLVAVGLYLNVFDTWMYYVIGGIFGAMGGAYTVTYESFYPSLITRGFETKAYSVSSLLQPLASTLLLPLSAIVYEIYGIEILFIFVGTSYFIAATFETQIKVCEQHLLNLSNAQSKKRKSFFEDTRLGLKYLKSDKGLVVVTAYFFVLFITGGVFDTLTLPFFKNTEGFTVLQYSIAMGLSTQGRLFGGFINYKFKIKQNRRFKYASVIYISLGLLHGFVFFFNFYPIAFLMFMIGMFSVTSYNIRISSTQTYIDDQYRGRYNGVFLMLTTLGGIIGKLIAGALGDNIETKYLVLIFSMLYIVGYFILVLPNKEAVKKIYNKSFDAWQSQKNLLE